MDKSESGGKDRFTRESIALALLNRITAGIYTPGQVLPGQARLRLEFGKNVSMTTLNAAVRILKEQGVLNVRRHQSTCVADPVPYRNRYAITFPNLPDPAHPTTFPSVLHRIALDRQRAGGDCEYTFYYGTNLLPERDQALSALSQEIRWHRVAGVLFASDLWGNVDDAILKEPGIARASVLIWHSDVAMPPMPRIAYDQPHRRSFRSRGSNWLREQGCRNAAVILYEAPPLEQTQAQRTALRRPWHRALAAAGLTTRPEWLHAFNGSGFETALLLMRGRETPDAVVITDDVLVPSVTAGLRAAGPPYPRVLAMANFPAVPQTHVPTCFLGHDIEALFDRCAASLRDPVAQRTCPVFQIPAIFEDEWRSQE